MELFQNYLQPLISFLHLHPHFAGMITFFVVFCEAMAVIGVIIPGSVTMTAIGVLMGTGVISITGNFIWAICGAILGDYLSYLIGVYYKNRLHRIWPFNKHPKLLARGEKFFRAHGGKSVMIGRFVGPMRAMIPMIAGMLKMPIGKFLLAAIPSASIWAVAYMLPGVLLGTLSLQLPPKLATGFLLWMMLTVVFIWLIVWLAQHFLKSFCRFLNVKTKALWLQLQENHHLKWLANFLAAQHRTDNHKQLAMFIAMLITTALFCIVLIDVINRGILTRFDQPLYHLLQSIRTPTLDKLMLAFSLLAEPRALLIAQCIFAIWLALKRHWYSLIHALAIIGLLFLSLDLIKFLVHVARPNTVLQFLYDYSFPSGHVSFSIAIYGFLALFIADELKIKKRSLSYAIVSVITFLVIASRLYLGAHWLSDIFGGIFLGSSLLFLVTISYRRHHARKTAPWLTVLVAICTFSIAITFYALRVFQKELIKYYMPQKPAYTIALKTWSRQNAEHILPMISLYRTNRLGHPTDAFNIQWVGDLADIEQKLISQGWQSYPARLNVKEIMRRITMRAVTMQRVPILSQLYNDRAEVLLLTKNGVEQRPMLILRLWKTNIAFSDSLQHLWIGTIDYYRPVTAVDLKNRLHKARKFVGSAKELIPYLKGFDWQKILLPLENQPVEMHNLQWNGNLLLIKSKK